MSETNETHHRSVLKAISWRVVASTTTMLLVFAFTGKLALSAGIGIVEVFVKGFAYYLHERIWGVIGVGKRKHPLESLPVERPLAEKDMGEIREKLKSLGYISK